MDISVQAINEDIAYFQNLLDDLDREGFDAQTLAVAEYYQPFIDRRRQLLAAVEAGRPEAWREFAA